MAFNNGQPLTPDQIQTMRQQIGVIPVTPTQGASDQWAKVDQLTGRASVQAPAQPSYLDRVKQAFGEGIRQTGDAVSEIINPSQSGGVVKGLQQGLKAESGIGSTIMSPVTAAVSPYTTPVINSAADALQKAPVIGPAITGYGHDIELRGNTNKNPGVEQALSMASDAGNVAGTIAGFKGVERLPGAAADATQATVDSVKGAIDTGTQAVKQGLSPVRDLATSITPNMQTLIDRVKTNPTEAAQVAEQLRGYFKTAETAKGTTGALTPLNQAGEQFKTGMTALRQKMKTTGETMKSAVKSVADAPVSGVGDVLKNLQSETADRLGAEYAAMSETPDIMGGMNGKERVQFLNDVLDGKQPDPFGGEGVFRSAPGREITVRSQTDLKKLADMHETLAQLGENPTVQQIHDVVQRWQSDLYKSNKPGAEPIDSAVKALMKQTIGQLNELSKQGATVAEKERGLTPGAYADAKANYARLADLQETMSRRLGEKYKNAPSLIKSIFSPQNRDLNKYIKQLEDETGVKIFDHATLADYAMRSVDDPRIKSMLERTMEGGMTKHQLVRRMLTYIAKKLEDPEGKALRQLGQDAGPTMKDAQLGLSTKSVTGDTTTATTPEKVASRIDAEDKNIIRYYLQDHKNASDAMAAEQDARPLIEGMGIKKLSDADQKRFLKEVLDLSEQPRDELGRFTSKKKVNAK